MRVGEGLKEERDMGGAEGEEIPPEDMREGIDLIRWRDRTGQDRTGDRSD